MICWGRSEASLFTRRCQADRKELYRAPSLLQRRLESRMRRSFVSSGISALAFVLRLNGGRLHFYSFGVGSCFSFLLHGVVLGRDAITAGEAPLGDLLLCGKNMFFDLSHSQSVSRKQSVMKSVGHSQPVSRSQPVIR